MSQHDPEQLHSHINEASIQSEEAATNDIEVDEGPSKTEVKQQMKAITDLGMEIAELGPSVIKQLPLSEDIRDAYEELKRIKGQEARKRHFKRIGKLLRDFDREPLELALERKSQGLPIDPQKHQNMLAVDHWFQALIIEKKDPELFIAEHPECPRQNLRQKIRTTIKAPEKDQASFKQFLKQWIDYD